EMEEVLEVVRYWVREHGGRCWLSCQSQCVCLVRAQVDAIRVGASWGEDCRHRGKAIATHRIFGNMHMERVVEGDGVTGRVDCLRDRARGERELELPL